MTTRKSSVSEAPADRELVITRDFDAPRELVWRAMTDPNQVVKWWGPRGFTTTIEEMDVRVGGVWRQVMHGPDGTDYPNQSVFTEVVEPERLVYSHGGGKKGAPEVNFMMTWTLDALENGTTRLTLRQVYPTAEMRETVVRVYGAIEGAKQTMARLAEELAKEPADDRDFQISRVFDAPRELMWKVWTEPEHMAKWWGPHNFTCPVCELDVRVGGAYRITMRAQDGREFPCKGFYREIVKPERLVTSMDLSEHPDSWFDLVMPDRDRTKKPGLDCVQTVTFEEVEGKTRLTIRTRFESKAIRDVMVKMGMNDGWSQSLERLAQRVTGVARAAK